MNWPGIILAVAAFPAVGGWALAAISGIQLFLLVPQGQRMAGYGDLSMWRFDRLRQRVGPAAEPLMKRMKLGGIVFALSILVILLAAALSIAFPGTAAVGEGTAAEPARITDPRIVTVRTAIAPPGAPLSSALES